MCKDMSVTLTKELMHGEFALSKQGKRKGNRGRLLTGNGVTKSTVDKGHRVFRMVSVETKEVRLFKVDVWGAATLGEKITQNISPGTTIHSDKCIPTTAFRNLVGATGSSWNYVWQTVNHTEQFVDPTTPALTPRTSRASGRRRGSVS
ncbi:hypothetical protein HPB48_022856 [Haemaphysalis longicornis]|uniref:Uncharacterized protein n=1 Tax=Haemaphysalis longicornis TaxID=44386 RepID=A0A9J6FQ24_HAELO|nr:hypothetical protein HPB48_022856 [Haemaphysalis longicornis]